MTLNKVKARLEFAHHATISDVHAELHLWAEAFDCRVLSWFSSMEILNVGDITKKVNALIAEIYSISKSHMMAILIVAPPLVQSVPPPTPRHFNLIAYNHGFFLVVRTKRDQKRDL